MTTYRPCITGSRHMISAGHYSAAHAGFQILEAGGNAIDAGVAAGIAVSVLQTDRVNFAGVAPLMIYLATRAEGRQHRRPGHVAESGVHRLFPPRARRRDAARASCAP